MSALETPLSMIGPEGVVLERTAPPEVVRPKGITDIQIGPVMLSGTLSGSDDEYLFRGRVSGTYMAACDRCLDPVVVPYDIDVTWVFVQGAVRHPLEEMDEDDDDESVDEVDDGSGVITFEGNTLDLAPATWEEIALAIPAKILCRDECAGLCPVCGVNRNRTQCKCDTGQRTEKSPLGHAGLKALGEMFPNLRSNRTED